MALFRNSPAASPFLLMNEKKDGAALLNLKGTVRMKGRECGARITGLLCGTS
jgi:hypothetical protein